MEPGHSNHNYEPQQMQGEYAPAQGAEYGNSQRLERGAEAPAVAGEQAPRVSQAMPQQLPAPAPSTLSPQDNSAASGIQTPITAGDEDLIEKEWVMQAKDILQQTKDDPHGRELQLSQLRAQYIKKRYGRIIGEVQD